MVVIGLQIIENGQLLDPIRDMCSGRNWKRWLMAEPETRAIEKLKSSGTLTKQHEASELANPELILRGLHSAIQWLRSLETIALKYVVFR